MYQMPQPVGGYQPYNYSQVTYLQPVHYEYYNLSNDEEEESEYEYITDDEGDYVEDKNGNIIPIEEAQKRGLVKPYKGVRGIRRKLLYGGGAIIGGAILLKKHLKRKRRVKKPKSRSQSSNNLSPQNIYGKPLYDYGEVPSYMLGQPQYGYGQNAYSGS